MSRRSVLYLTVGVLLGVVGVLLGAFAFQRPYQYQGSLIEPPLQAGDFTLQDQHGNSFRLADQRGRVVLLFFGYTSCPDVCPTTLAEFKQVRERLGDKAAGVRFVFVTVDPERDTPERVGEYVRRFDPAFIGLSGTEAELQPVWDGYFVFREIPEHAPGSNYLVGHTGNVYAIDPQGNLRLTFPFGMAAESMADDVAHLLQGG